MGDVMMPVEQAQPGMVVSADVMDSSGRTIIPKGARLTPMAIKRLPKWGVRMLAVETDDAVTEDASDGESAGSSGEGESSEGTDTVFIDRVALEVEERFSSMESNTFNDEYKRSVIRNLVERGHGVVPGL